mgnify:CR=1 FL=1
MAAPNATVYKAELQVTDMDRHYYASHNLTLAQHPSETDLRLMARLIAFALFAEERLEFGRGLSNDEDPDLWLRNYTGEIDLWIDLGQPDESRIKKACGRAVHAVIVGYNGNAFDIWWNKIANDLVRFKNLTVIALPGGDAEASVAVLQRGMSLTAMIEDGELQLTRDASHVTMRPRVLKAAE